MKHAHFEATRDLVRHVRLREALGRAPKERSQDDVEHVLDFLRSVWRATDRLGPERTEQVARTAVRKTFPRGEDVVVEGDRGTTFYVIAFGSAAVKKDGRQVATLEVGGSFGEASLEAGAPRRNATITASSQELELLELHKRDYDRIMRKWRDEERRRAFECLKTTPMFRTAPPSPQEIVAVPVCSHCGRLS